MIITIDGPTASGKSTVARALAHRLHIYYLCSGLLFRALGYLLLKYKHYTLETIAMPKEQDIDEIMDVHFFAYHYSNEKEKIMFNGEDITPLLKSSTIDKAASIVSMHMYVRQKLLDYQRHIATQKSLVADGRDTGSIVFPHADFKFFLTASLQERAARWQKDQEKRGAVFSKEQAMQTVNERDMRDSQREAAPLVVPGGAIVIDSTDLTIDEVVEKMIGIVKSLH